MLAYIKTVDSEHESGFHNQVFTLGVWADQIINGLLFCSYIYN